MNASRVLREARRRAGLSQRELARATGIAQPTIARIEAGASIPRVDSLDRLLRACGDTLLAIARPGRGVDVTLFETFERLSPAERIAANQSHSEGIRELRSASRVAEGSTPSLRILEVLRAHRVRFVLIGGMAGVVLGSPVRTDDLDVCYSRDPENISRLVGALRSIGATLRGAPRDAPFILDERTIINSRNFTFDTEHGSVDCVGEPAGVTGFDELDRNAETVYYGGGAVRVCSLSDLIRMKLAAGRLKDRMHLEYLAAMQDRRDAGDASTIVIEPVFAWGQAIEAVRALLSELTEELGAQIEHVGSTAVPGLAGRPIMDVDLVLRTPEQASRANDLLTALGYEQETGQTDAAFRAPEGMRYHRLMLVVTDSKVHQERLLFRDFMRDHPEEVQRYAALKRRLAAEFAHDPELYDRGKAPYIEEILTRARAERDG